jgi:hypothetical protein
MPRYIDKDKLIRDLIDNRNFYPAIVKRAIENAPTEGVVPRSEVEKAKQEVAREIFEEIDTTIRTDIKANNRYYGDYQEGRNNAFYTVIRQLAELRKKYIGE